MENWTIQEMKRLFQLCGEAQKQNKGLKTAFETIAKETNRKPNSVRNYYYAQVKTLSLLPEYGKSLGISAVKHKKSSFKLFSDAEIKKLIKDLLIRQSSGESVRAITSDMAAGDKSKMLRLQNKYRSVVFHKKPYVAGLMKEMKAEGATFINPYTRRVVIKGAEENTGAAEVENVNELLKQFFEAGSEQDKMEKLTKYMSSLSGLLSNIK